MTPVLEVHHLTKAFGDVVAVRDVGLAVAPGEVYALIGLNGAGKTTLMRAVLGMVRPSCGRVVVPPWGQVGHLVETPTAYPELTVRENLEVAARLQRLTGSAARRAVDDVVGLMGLGPCTDRRAHALSLGNRQRLGLARALLHRPRLLVLDEPVNGLDPAGVAEIRSLLQRVARDQGVAVLLSSHLLGEVARVAGRIGVLHEGRLVCELDAESLERRAASWLSVGARDLPAAREALAARGFRAVPDGAGGLRVEGDRALRRPEDVATVLVSAGVAPTRLCVEEQGLEDLFLELVGAPEEVSRAGRVRGSGA